MANMYAYMRISTKEDREKQRFTRQENALTKYAADNKIEYVFQFREDVSGKSFKNRTEWQRLEKIVQPGDTIVFKDISRFTREAEAGYTKYMSLMQKGINLIFLDNPTVSTDYIRELLHVAEQQDLVAKTSLESTVKLLLIVELNRAEQERLTISKRTKDGMQAAKEKAEREGREWRAGRKPGQLDKMTDELQADIVLYLSDRSIKASELMRKHNISRNTFKKYVEKVKEEM
ncbi:MAG: recombinase family protein [Lachnospiraceae bacterium]|nr:recombinase family protein [Lachnospiraceae bacterium]